jgi:hypothetical protein
MAKYQLPHWQFGPGESDANAFSGFIDRWIMRAAASESLPRLLTFALPYIVVACSRKHAHAPLPILIDHAEIMLWQ